MRLETWAVLGGLAASVVAVLAGLAAAVRWARVRWRPVAEFLEDWRGEPARPGVPRRLGVMERVSALETSTAVIRAEVTPNGGGSLKDVVVAIDARTRADGELLGRHVTWHRNSGAVDPTATVLLAREPDGTS